MELYSKTNSERKKGVNNQTKTMPTQPKYPCYYNKNS